MSNVPPSVVREKVRQASGLMREHGLPLWVVQFAQETDLHPEPCQDLAVGTTVTWPSAFIITDNGSSIAIVGTGDVGNIEAFGAYDSVIGYVQDVGPELLRVLGRFAPARIGVSTSVDDFAADCITLGKYRRLEELLAGSEFANRLVSAESVLSSLRARKLPSERALIERAIEITLGLFEEIAAQLRIGISECELANFIHGRMRDLQLDSAWDRAYDPVVNFGPGSSVGHAAPGATALEPGHLVHVDLGIKYQGYCSDLQRTWYVARDGQGPPDDVARAFETLTRSLAAGFDAIDIGVEGWRVDAAARDVIVSAGYEAPQFALGHQLGQNAHDGAGLLGPTWARYGSTPYAPIEPDSVYTIEFGLDTSAGLIGLEEDLIVTTNGPRYLEDPQTELPVLRLA